MLVYSDDKNNEIPSFEQMMKPILTILDQSGGSASIRELDEAVMEHMKIPEDMRQIPHKNALNRTEIAYRLAWARTYLKRYGLINNEVRGTWKLTEKYQGKPEEIDVSEIVRMVRNEGNGEENSLSAIGFAQAFENLVFSILREKTEKEKKPVYLTYGDFGDHAYDIEAPEGVDSYEGPVRCIARYVTGNSKNRYPMLHKLLEPLYGRVKDGTILIAVSCTVSREDREKIGESSILEQGIPVVIWDQTDLYQMVDPESDYANYLINPRQALVEDALRSKETDEERQRRRRAHIEGLKAAYRRQDMMLFLGAGVSKDAGIPLWAGIINEMLIHMISAKTKEKKLSSAEQKILCKLAYDNKEDSPLTQMRYIRSAFSDEEYYRIVHGILYAREANMDSPLLSAIAKISAPHRSYNGIKGIVTYNFDDLLERKFEEKEIEYNTVSCENDMALNDKLNIYHVHGYLPGDFSNFAKDPGLVFSEEDYHRVYRDAYSWSNLVQLNAFRDNTCVFVGCSLTDPNLRRLLDVAARKGESSRHYAFLQRKNISARAGKKERHKELLDLYEQIDDYIREGYFRELGLNIIWFDEFSEIPEILLGIME